jgi:predicted lipoprotein with Yx(FWY)xxD motif
VIQRRIVLLSAAGLASVLLLAACGSSTEKTSTGTSPGSVAPVATAASQSATPAPAGSSDSGSGHMATTTMLMAKTVGGMGSVVTDDKGMTLYRYDKDEANPSKWTCAGECTKTWIPVIVQDSVQTMGVEKSLLGTVHRNGLKQLTLGGWPLYRYVGDTQAGQTNGQAKGNTWYAVTPSGTKSTSRG